MIIEKHDLEIPHGIIKKKVRSACFILWILWLVECVEVSIIIMYKLKSLVLIKSLLNKTSS